MEKPEIYSHYSRAPACKMMKILHFNSILYIIFYPLFFPATIKRKNKNFTISFIIFILHNPIEKIFISDAVDYDRILFVHRIPLKKEKKTENLQLGKKYLYRYFQQCNILSVIKTIIIMRYHCKCRIIHDSIFSQINEFNEAQNYAIHQVNLLQFPLSDVF